MTTPKLALITEKLTRDDVSTSYLNRVAAALQAQVKRDAAPIWHIDATISAFDSLEEMPLGYWPIIIQPEVKGAEGIHLDRDGIPFALVKFGPTWSLTASHEILEMLVDPMGSKVVVARSPKPEQGQVEVLVEVCDPCEHIEYSYSIGGIIVSDFYTQRYFDADVIPGTQYDFRGAISRPMQMLQGGYISWHDRKSDHWFQQTFFEAAPKFRDLGKLVNGARSIRSQIYELTATNRQSLSDSVPSGAGALLLASVASVEHDDRDIAQLRATSLRAQIRAMMTPE